ncbi:MAG: RDD family protein [Nitrospinaceae bacterium]
MEYPKAGFLRRFAALLIDVIILDILGALVTIPLQRKFDLEVEDILEPFLTGTHIESPVMVFLVLQTVIITGLWTFYFTFFIGAAGQTLGKRLLGLRVVRDDGQPMNYQTGFNRFIGYSLSASVFFLGFLWALFDREKKAWHDRLFRTSVVRVSFKKN